MIEPKYATLQTLFADRVFRIPHYQRFYSWHTKQREDLFSDLRLLADREGDNHHFMATIVCHKTKDIQFVGANEYRVYDIVDGQQRLTTLILLLKCIELALDKKNPDRREIAEVLVKRDGHLILLQTNNANEAIFNAFIRKGREPKKADIRTHADRNLSHAICECTQFVESWSEARGDVMPLLRLIRNRLGFVAYDIEDSRIVYSIFEVLNSRGLAVDWLDKCKSVLMGRAFELAKSPAVAEAGIKELQKLWGEIYQEVAEVSLKGQEILRVAATLHYGPIRGKPQQAPRALENFRQECKTADDPRRLTEIIHDVTRKLVAIEKNVLLGPVTRVLHARMLAVALESSKCLNEAELQQALDQWERVTFRIFGLRRQDARRKVGEYTRLATKFIKGGTKGASTFEQVMSSLRELGKDFPIDEAVEAGLENSNCYVEAPELCRYVLWRYEEYLARSKGKGATVNPHVRIEIWQQRAIDTIEHIYPQKPKPDGAWARKMRYRGKGNRVKRFRDHVHRIGNLILLPQALNSEAQNHSFEDKKPVYDKHNLRMVKEVLKENDWMLDDIDAREKKILAWAKTEWCDVVSNNS